MITYFKIINAYNAYNVNNLFIFRYTCPTIMYSEQAIFMYDCMCIHPGGGGGDQSILTVYTDGAEHLENYPQVLSLSENDPFWWEGGACGVLSHDFAN